MSYLNEHIIQLVGGLSRIPLVIQQCLDKPSDEKQNEVIEQMDFCEEIWDKVKVDVVKIFAGQGESEESAEGIPTGNGVLIKKKDVEQ